MKITAIRLDNFGTGHYRITHPLTELEKLGHKVNIIQAEYGLRMNSGQFVGDILWVQRMNDTVIYRMVESIPEHLRPVIVYDIDDLVWDTHVDRCSRSNSLSSDLKRTVPPMLRGAFAVTCSTPELAEECQQYNGNTHVVKNAIDFDGRDWNASINRPSEAEGKIVIGWSGSGWHKGDLDVIGKALRGALLDHPEVHFIGQGDAPNLCQWLKGLRLPSKRVSVIDWMHFDNHPSVYSLFDIGIAALSSNRYNRCKSELKLMELGARGIPYVASNVAPYRRFHTLSDGKCGYLAKSESDWRWGLEELIKSEARRVSMGDANRCFTHRNYSLSARAKELEGTFKCILASRNSMKNAAEYATI